MEELKDEGEVGEEEEERLNALKNLTREDGDGVCFICLVAMQRSSRQLPILSFCLVASSHFCSLIIPSTRDSRPDAGNADFRLQPGPSRVTLRGGRRPARLRGRRITVDGVSASQISIFPNAISGCTRPPITVINSCNSHEFFE
jgi:hypothetical protein